jgi:hypothetical protein
MSLAPPLKRSAKKAARNKSQKTLSKAVHEPVRKSARAPKDKLQQPRPAIE